MPTRIEESLDSQKRQQSPARAAGIGGVPLRVTERMYSQDNHEFSFCSAGEAGGCWLAWSAYGPKGSRGFVRRFDGARMSDIAPLSDSVGPQLRPLCVPTEGGARLVWFEKDGETVHIAHRIARGDRLGAAERLVRLPDRAKASELQGVEDDEGALWLAWQQAETGRCAVELLRVGPDGVQTRLTMETKDKCDHRPRLAAHGQGVYVVWDAYVDRRYDVFGCAVTVAGKGGIVRISQDGEWESKAALCRDAAGRLFCVWVRWKDVLWKRSVIHQKFSLRGAWFDGSAWQAWTANDGGADLAPMHYGLLQDLDNTPPALGHQGRRLHPMLRAAEDGGVWLFYETKADDSANTVVSRGRLVARRWRGSEWVAGPLDVAHGRVYYDLPAEGTVGDSVQLVSRRIDREDGDDLVDELFLERVPLSESLPLVPEEARSVDLTQWEEVTLPLPGLDRGVRQPNQLPLAAAGAYRLIYGDFHVHAVGSVECEGELDELAHYARDKACLNALTISDNDHFWSPGIRGTQRWMTDYEWDQNLGNAKAINAPGEFALFPGYEQTIGSRFEEVNRRLQRNHSSVMADDDDMERELLEFAPEVQAALAARRRDTNKDIGECVRWAKKKGYFPLPHAHVNWWRLVDPSVQTCCDVTTAWMRNIEEYEIYHEYLNKGLKFGFTGSSDSHYRNPGLGGSVTGLWVKDVSRAGVLEALRARRVYATAGQRIIIEFSVNDTFMGGEVAVSEDPILRWRVEAEEGESYTLNFLRNGRPMHSLRFTGSTEGEFVDERLVIHRMGRHYYYLEVVSDTPIPAYGSNVSHALGGRAWSSPIWLETSDCVVG